jgi:hypothetical protein
MDKVNNEEINTEKNIEQENIEDNNEENYKDKECKINNLIKIDEYVKDYEWTLELEEECKKIICENDTTVNEKILDEFLETQGKNWEKFYKFNKTNFFKDRHYLLKVFPELKDDERVYIII